MKDMNDKLGLVGIFEITLKDKDGNVKSHETLMNGITNIGFDQACGLLADPAAFTKLGFIGIGWGLGADGAFVATQTDFIGTEPTKRNRLAAAYTHTIGTKLFTLMASWGVNLPVASTVDIGEIGVFWSAAAGYMFSRLPRSSRLNKLATDTLEIRWTLTLA